MTDTKKRKVTKNPKIKQKIPNFVLSMPSENKLSKIYHNMWDFKTRVLQLNRKFKTLFGRSPQKKELSKIYNNPRKNKLNGNQTFSSNLFQLSFLLFVFFRIPQDVITSSFPKNSKSSRFFYHHVPQVCCDSLVK